MGLIGNTAQEDLALGVKAAEEVEVAMTEEIMGLIGNTAQEGRVAAEEEKENLSTVALVQEVKVTVEEV